ncbi:DGQHR domain-containing protein [Franconibacter sp. IITDAS19]|uniref:DGQHR domain-containing protein n=1 Tax=Franconibacter sp. IITDAS19 TaxID=2930569 RepID=UPI001FF908DF|nr:DGQHR domain-containing protein [Franconibacter sp. IITDAS19]MCK1969292.1 DGQHR domain-containing protein [Franconibacter sp. IITDAS19]
MKAKYIEVNQPIGTFYLSSVKANKLINMVRVENRNDFEFGVQRERSTSRVNEIAEYTGDPDATFPTPIIIAVDHTTEVNSDENYFYFDNGIIGDVIDGQHRLWGIKKSKNADLFELPVVFMFNLTNEEKAYVFSIINSKQTKVNPSLVYDLFSLSENRSPQKTCHEIARSMNNDRKSPFYNRLKMLGKKKEGQDNASISQSSFIKYLLPNITKKADEDLRALKRGESLTVDDDCIFRNYFIDDNDAVIIKILNNLFNAVKDVFSAEWNDPKTSNISKLPGYAAIMKAFPFIYAKGVREGTLEYKFMYDSFGIIKQKLYDKDIFFTAANLGTNEAEINKMANEIRIALTP